MHVFIDKIHSILFFYLTIVKFIMHSLVNVMIFFSLKMSFMKLSSEKFIFIKVNFEKVCFEKVNFEKSVF